MHFKATTVRTTLQIVVNIFQLNMSNMEMLRLNTLCFNWPLEQRHCHLSLFFIPVHMSYTT